jgi:hypothetical protein
MPQPVLPTLRQIQADVSRAYCDLDLLYRTHQSRRLAILPKTLAKLTDVTGELSNLISDLHNVPSAPTRRRLEEK